MKYLKKEYKMNFLKTFSILIIISASGCASLSPQNLRINDENLKKKAATSLFTTPDKITVSDKENSSSPTNPNVNSIKFIATLDQKPHFCFVQTSGNIIISDAVCSGSALLDPKKKHK